MSCILYYSNYCEHSRKLLQSLSKTTASKDIHFICIDKRVTEGGKMYLVLENGQKIIMPEQVNRVPALLLLNNYQVLYGDAIYKQLKPQQEVEMKKATQNHLEPMAFSLGGGNFGILSDQYSYLDMDADSLSAKGDGGVRQMHNYVTINHEDRLNTPAQEDFEMKGANKIPANLTIEQLQAMRDKDISGMGQGGTR